MLGERYITLRRATGGGVISTTTGEPTAVNRSSQKILAAVQPGTGRTSRQDGSRTMVQPQGHRQREQRRVFTRTPLMAVDQVGQDQADRLEFDGGTWVVMNVSGYTPTGLGLVHDEVTCIRLAEGQS